MVSESSRAALQVVLSASPDVKAALIGNLGIVAAAIVTVVATAIFATRQFRHERREKAKDRALEVKKDVLLDGVRGAQQLLFSVGSFGNVSRTPEQITGDFQAGLGLLTTAGAVASVRTVKKITELTERAGPLVLKLMSLRRPLDDLHSELGVVNQEIENLTSENRRIVEMQRTAIAGRNAAEAQFHNECFQAGHSAFSNALNRRVELTAQLECAQVPLISESLRRQAELAEIVRELVAEVRIDIQVDDGRNAFLEASYVDVSARLKVLEKALDKIRSA